MKEQNNTKTKSGLTQRVTQRMSKTKKYTISQATITVTRQQKQLSNNARPSNEQHDYGTQKNKDLLCTKKRKRIRGQTLNTFLIEIIK